FYDSLRDSIVNAELFLLRVLKFDLKIILPFSYLTKALHLTLAIWEIETTESTPHVNTCLMNTIIGSHARCRIMDAMSDYRLSTLYDPETLSSACLWYALRNFKILPDEKFMSWVVSVTGNTQIHEDIRGRNYVRQSDSYNVDAIYDLTQLDLRRHEQHQKMP
ncbi:hypothetical protein PCK2_000882, partial [Pneumocystis canis]